MQKNRNLKISGPATFGFVITMVIMTGPFSITAVESKSSFSTSTHYDKLSYSISNNNNLSSDESNILSAIAVHNSSNSNTNTSSSSNNSGSIHKIVMINFDDGYKSQIIYAKPILDKYGFKASFFIVFGKVATQPSWLNWQDIALLKKDGMDIESHTMTHAHLNTLAKMPDQLSYEIAGSKQCLASHGYNAAIFGYPNNLGSNTPLVVNMVAKYHNVGRSGTDPLMFLNCSGRLRIRRLIVELVCSLIPYQKS